jgi:hypothetical protein
MKFRSPTAAAIYLALTSGHTHVIGPELAEVPQRFHRMAVAEGAIPEGMDSLPAGDDDGPPDKQALIKTAIEAMVAEADAGDFTADGKPHLSKLSAKAGFTVSRQERDEAWDALSDEDKG